jgi:GT2 family glycosyltransferase
MNNPLVTVNILSYNRKDELRNTLTKVYEQDYKNIEVIVVDNASTDGSPEMVEREFPEVKLIRLKENIGIAGWNKGFEEAKGEYVLVLDDDSYPHNKSIINGLEIFKKDLKIGIVAFNILNSTFNFYETLNWHQKPFAFVGCGALFSAKYLRDVGNFDENIFIYLNELELTARFLDKGYEIFFCNECHIVHAQSFNSRGNAKNPFASKYRYEHFFWSMTYFLLTKFSFPYVIFIYLKWLLNRFLIAVKNVWIFLFFKQVFITSKKFPVIIHNRKPLRKGVQKFYKYGNVFAFFDRDFFSGFRK